MILLVTATAKLYSAGSPVRVLDVPDPVLAASHRQVFIWVGALELVLAAALVFGRDIWLKLSLTMWLSTMFLIYRFALSAIGSHKPCNCLGSIPTILHLSEQTLDQMMFGISLFLFLGSVVLVALSKSGQSLAEKSTELDEYQTSP